MTTLDHFDPSFTADPYTTWAAMRAEDPVWYWADLDSFMILDHHLAREILRDGETFTLNRYAWEHFEMQEADRPRWPLLTVTFEDGIFQAAPTDHARLRKLVVPTFSPAAAERHRPLIQEVIDELVGEWRPGDTVDLAADLAVVAPVRIISRLLGVDPSRDDWFQTMAADITALADPTAGPEVMDRAEVQLGHFKDLLESATGDGLYRELLSLQEDGDRLSPTETFSLVVALMTAGMETTASAMSLGALALMAHPDQAELLRSEPDWWPAAVVELLRYSYIGYGLTRFATREVELGGHTIRAGQLIWINVGAALHDPAVFPDPERLDIARGANEGLPFGFGAHYCLGAALAKVEIECALRTLVERFPAMRPAGDPAWRLHMLLRGPSKLPVRL